MKRRPGKFWKISELAVLFETSQSAIVDAARICAIPILPTGMIFLPTTPGNRARRGLIEESHRAHLSNESQRARIEARQCQSV